MNQKIIVTGSDGLIGSKSCDYFSNLGYEVIGFDIAQGHDLRDENRVRELMAENSGAVGLINAFALNPQPSDSAPDVALITADSFRAYLEVNLVALFCVCREFVRHSAKNTSIINFSSIHAVRSPKHFMHKSKSPKHIGYNVSKAGVLGLSSYLATYYAPHIRVNTVVPGGIQNGQSAEFQKMYSGQVPMGRMMSVDELMSTLRYLLDPESSYTTGAVVEVDGGWLAW